MSQKLLHKFQKNFLFMAWLAIVIYIFYGTLIPFDISFSMETFYDNLSRTNLRPFSYFKGLLNQRMDTLSNILLFLPYGFFLYLYLPWHYSKLGKLGRLSLTIFSSLGFSLIIEFIQLFSYSRISSANDCFNNTLGAALGAFGAYYLQTHYRDRLKKLFEVIFTRPLLLGLIGYGLFICLIKFFPYDITLEESDVFNNIRNALGVFRGSTSGTGDFSLQTILIGSAWSFILFIPFSFTASLYLKRYTVLNATLISLILGGFVCLGVETGRLFILGGGTAKFYEGVAGVAGSLFGSVLASLFWKHKHSILAAKKEILNLIVRFINIFWAKFSQQCQTRHRLIIATFVCFVVWEEARFLWMAIEKAMEFKHIVPGFLSIMSLTLIIFRPFFGIIIFLVVGYFVPSEVFGMSTSPLVSFGGHGLSLTITIMTLFSWLVQMGREGKFKILLPRQGYYLLCLYGLIVASIIFASSREDAGYLLSGITKIVIFYFLTANLINSRKYLNYVIWTIILMMGILAIKEDLNFMLHGEAFPVDPVFGDNNYLAQLFTLAIPFIFYFIFVEHGYFKRVLLFLLLPATIFCTILTFSRAGFLGLITVCGLIILKSKYRLFFMFIVVLMAMGIFVFGYNGEKPNGLLPQGYKERINTIISYQQDSSSMYRVYAYEAGIRMIRENPLTGVGLGNFVPLSQRYNPLLYSFRPITSHNSFIQIAAECGLIAFFIFILFLISTGRDLWRIRKKFKGIPDEIVPYTNMIEVSLCAYLVWGSFSSEAYMAIMYIIMALTVSLNRIVGKGDY